MKHKAAVVLLHETTTDALILTKRTQHLKSHPGEYCFPGGVEEKQDQSLWNTALRELYEELGIDERRVRLQKPMTPESTLSNVLIYPWLATIQAIEPYVINEAEVEHIIRLPMQDVLNTTNYQAFAFKKGGQNFTSFRFTAS